MFVKDKAKTITHPDDQALPIEQRRAITVRAKMNHGQQAAFWDEVNQLNRAAGGLASNAHYNLLLLAHNITGWAGPPEEDGTPFPAFNEEMVSELDPFDALVVAVTDYLLDANQRKESPDPKSATEAAGTISSDAGTTVSTAA